MNRRLPVTLVGGFLGAGKTSLLHHIISEHQGGNLAMLVENPGALNLDAKALRGLCGAMRRLYDTVLEIPTTDDAAQAEWIISRLRDLAEAGRYERVLIEVSGTSSAAHLGRQSDKFAPWAELQHVVTVVDALDFYRSVVAAKGGNEPSALVDFQKAQIEGASLLVLNKADLVREEECAACTQLLRQINPRAKIIVTAYGEIPAEIWTKASASQLEPTIKERPELAAGKEDSSALSSMLYRAYRPFHPERFWKWFNADHPGLLRVKGIIWLASRNLLVGGISRTRWENTCGGAGVWWAALPHEEWPEEPEALLQMQETWREPYGDRRQELVLIGDAAQLTTITQQLNACLLTAEEYARPLREWAGLFDPFPEWDLGED